MTTYRTPISERVAHLPLLGIGYRPGKGIGNRSVNVAEVEEEKELLTHLSTSTSPNVSRDFRHVDVESRAGR